MSNYTITTDFGAKDSLPSSNDSKVVRGSEFTTEFTNIQTAIATKADTAGDTFTGVVNFSADVAVNTNTLFVDVSADKVGIGTSSPLADLHVSNGTNSDSTPVEFMIGGSANSVRTGSIIKGTTSGAYNLTLQTSNHASENQPLIIKLSDATEAMRIKADGNVLVGTTSTAIAEATTETGIVLNNGGWYEGSRDGGTVGYFNRLSSDGEILSFRKDGTNVGTIGTNSGNIFLSDGARSLIVDGSVIKAGYSTGGDADNVQDLGSSSVRFKDLHLSGTGYFGTSVGIGTTSPNESLVVKGGTYAANQSGGMALQMGDTSGSHWQSSFKIKSDGSGNVRTAIDASTGAIGGQSQEVISINTAGNVGIGATSPTHKLEVQEVSPTNGVLASFVNSTNSGGTKAAIQFSNADNSNCSTIIGSNRVGADFGADFYIANSDSTDGTITERFRIDEDGNVLVGTTDGSVYDSTSGGNTGFVYSPNGFLQVARETTTSTQSVMNLNKMGVDGNIIELYKDGSTVGSIGTTSGDMYLSTGSRGIHISDGANSIVPCNATGGDSDATTSLGLAGARFKDLYLSGGVYVGGTTSANKLDDYEEGTWTPVLEDISGNTTTWAGSVQGFYTKIGNTVNAWYLFNSSNTAITNRAYTIIRGLPFANSMGERASVATISRVFGLTMSDSNYYSGVNGTAIDFLDLDSGNDRVTFTPTGVQQRFTGGVTYRTS